MWLAQTRGRVAGEVGGGRAGLRGALGAATRTSSLPE